MKLKRSLRWFLVLCSLMAASTGLAGLSSCGSGGSGTAADIASFAANFYFYYIATPTFPLEQCENPDISAVHKMQCAYGTADQVVMVDYTTATPDPVTNVSILEQDEVATVMSEHKIGNEFTCASSAEASTCGADPENASCGPQDPVEAGTNGLPTGMTADWSGANSGGCGTWSTAMCNRVLGRTAGEVTQDEWNAIATAIGQSAAGGANMTGQGTYYEGQGYCVQAKKFNQGDYAEIQEKLDAGCDVKLFFWKREAGDTYANGHTETVTAATSTSATTNSWGQSATVSGGSDGGFSHTGGAFNDSSTKWPAGSTEVWVQYVCECSAFESFARWLGF